jgi:carbon-monoxide dehydrogenase large subunit
LEDYRLPLVFEMPECENFSSHICPDPLPDGPYGAKGMSESVVSAAAAAITTALYNAVGVRMNSYPMTAEKVLAAIRAKEGGS